MKLPGLNIKSDAIAIASPTLSGLWFGVEKYCSTNSTRKRAVKTKSIPMVLKLIIPPRMAPR